MKKQITLTIDCDYDDKIIESVLLDAFSEFSNHRCPVQEYVNKRHSWMSDEQKENKSEEVSQRVDIGIKLHSSVFDSLQIASEKTENKAKELLELLNVMSEQEKDLFSKAFANEKEITPQLIQLQIEYCKSMIYNRSGMQHIICNNTIIWRKDKK